MGMSFDFHCDKCGYKFQVDSGAKGFLTPTVTASNLHRYIDMFDAKVVKKFFNENPDGKITATANYLGRCVECGAFAQISNWIMSVLEKEARYYSNRCLKCGGEFEIFSEDAVYKGAFECPNCHTKLVKEFIGIWD